MFFSREQLVLTLTVTAGQAAQEDGRSMKKGMNSNINLM
jgi:hypothetical protein